MKSEFENIVAQEIAQLDKQQAEIDSEKKRLKNALAAYLRKEEEKIDILPQPKKDKKTKGKSAVKQAAIVALFSEGETLSNKAAAERAKMNGINSDIGKITSALNTLKNKGILEGIDRGLFRRPLRSEQVSQMVDVKDKI